MNDADVMHETPLHIAADHPAFDGHFPGRPLLPGVVLLAQVLEAALAVPAFAARVGLAPRIASVKFLSPVRPGDELLLRLYADEPASTPRLRFEVRTADDRLAASGQFDTARDIA